MDAKVWLKRAVTVFVILLVAYFGIGYIGEFSKIRVTVNNVADISLVVCAKLNVSGNFVSSEVFTIPPHSRQVVVTWNVHAGSHQIYVLWGAANLSDSGLEAYPFTESVSHSYYLEPFTMKKVVVDTVSPNW